MQDDAGFFAGLPPARKTKSKGASISFADPALATRLRHEELERKAAALQAKLDLYRAHEAQHQQLGPEDGEAVLALRQNET